MAYTRKFFITLFTLVSALSFSPEAGAKVIYVDFATGQNYNNFDLGWGLSWAQPCKDLVHALYWAAQGDEIWISQGTYYPCQAQDGLGTPSANRNLSFYTKNAVKIYGGFSKAAGAITMALRNPAVYITTLSGDVQKDNNYSNNAYRVISTQINGIGGFAVLDGVTVTGANMPTNTVQIPVYGGGISIINISPVINNCRIINNRSTQGGGVFCDNSSPTFSNCTFDGNSVVFTFNTGVLPVSKGGAVYNKGGAPVFNNCTFNANLAVYDASNNSGIAPAVYNNFSNAQFNNCSFTNNTSTNLDFTPLPSAIVNEGASPKYSGCTISNNGGRGMYSLSGATDQIINCVFTGNNGGVRVERAGTKIYNCRFTLNINPQDGIGGAISLYDTKGQIPVVSNCLINENSANRGGGIDVFYSAAKVNNCTITSNHAGVPGGGGVYNIGRGYNLSTTFESIYPSSMLSEPIEYSNCIVYGNSGGNGNFFDSLKMNFFTEQVSVSVYQYPFGTTVLTSEYRPIARYCMFGKMNQLSLGQTMAYDGGFNLVNIDPKFVSPPAANYTLNVCSQAVNSGNNGYVPGTSPTYLQDLNGNPRFYSGNVDRGCYELQVPFGGAITNTTQSICQGQTAVIFGLPQTVAGVYTKNYPLPNGCDSTAQVTLLVNPLPKAVVTASNNCFSTGTLNIKPSVGTAPFTIKLNNVVQNGIAADSSASFPNLTAGTYKYYITDANGCLDSANALLTTNTFPSSVVYVDSVAQGNNSGTSWANAFTDLQSAISKAACAGITQIWVAKGTYYPSYNTNGISVNTRAATFRMLNGITIYGGFNRATFDTTLTGRDWKKNATILSGDIQHDGDYSNNVYNVINNNGNGLNNSAVLDGFTITGANNTADAGGGISFGAGMTNSGSSPTIRNCTFLENKVTAIAQAFGAAIYNINCSPVISNCRFINNIVSGNYLTLGGAIYNDNSTPLISNCIFTGNNAAAGPNNGGGAISSANGAPITVSNCLFNDNFPGAINTYANNMNIINCTIFSNPGGAGFAGGINSTNASPAVTNCIIVGNSGNVSNNNSTPVFKNCDMENCGGSGPGWNTAFGTDAGGNITGNPTFTTDLHIAACSPCRNTGTNAGVAALDLDNNPRVVATTVDMGCYEFQASLAAYGAVIYVDSAATGLNNGTSWTNAYKKLDEALRLTNCTGVTSIYVSRGTYYVYLDENDGIPANYQSPTFKLRNGVGIYGGFSVADGITTLGARNPAIYKTILSGDQTNDGIWENNCKAVITAVNGLDSTALLDGFTIQDGYNNTTGTGAGIYINGASPAFNNCIIQYNRTAVTGNGLGAGVYVSNGNPKFTNCRFYSNSIITNADAQGAGVYNVNGNCRFFDCEFRYNTTDGYNNAFGAAIHSYIGTVSATRCRFLENNANAPNPAAGGVYINGGAPSKISNCFFTNNNNGALFVQTSDLTLINTTVVNNNSYVFPGGFYSIDCNPTLTNNIFYNNNQGNVSRQGAGTITVKNCLLQGSGGSTSWVPAFGTDGGGNIDVSPLFSADFHLTPCSPAINAGINPGLDALDLDHNPRLVAGIADLGCYESNIDLGIYGTRLYVNKAATGAKNGSSWANAFTDLQDAFSLAKCTGITEIYVSKGIYLPSANTSGEITNNQFSCFQMKNNLSVIGGFSVSNGDTSLSNRKPTLNATILSGEIQQDNDPVNNPYNVINNYNTGLDTTAVLDGFTVSNAHNDITGLGGGVINSNVSPKFLNCIFRDNFAGGTATARGAGMHNINSSPVLRNCSFINNNSSGTANAFGGGLSNDNSSPKLSRCIFSGNSVTNAPNLAGGAIYSNAGGGSIDNSLFYNNNGSAICADGSVYTLYNVTITGNSGTPGRGGGLFLLNTNFNILNSIVAGNADGNITNNSATPTFAFCNVEGSGGSGSWNSNFGINGGSNVDVNPLFTNDYHLQPCSPVINAGNNGSVAGSPDLDNTARIKAGNVDMGCYESQYLTVYSNRVYVNKNATGAKDGSSWASAFTGLEEALSLARCNTGIHEIYVSKGTYYPSADLSGNLVNNRSASFQMSNNLSIIGGFSADEGVTGLSARNPALYRTVLSGDIQQDGIQNNNVYNVVSNFNSGLDTTAVLDGFTISGAWNNSTGTGGGVNNVNSSPKFLNCVIRDNYVGGTATAVGAGMHNLNASPVIRYCQFINNNAGATTAAFGGGMFTNNGTPQISRCVFTGNTVTDASNTAGGAIYNTGGGSVIDNSLFTNNNGSAICTNNSAYTLYSLTITGNSGLPGRAGGLFLTGGSCTIFNSIVYGNLDGSITNNAVNPTFFFSDVAGSGASGNWNNAYGIDGGNNKDQDPLFTADYHLSNCSPLINSGDNGSYFGTLDLDNTDRIKSSSLDIGAYENEFANAAAYSNIAYVNASATGLKDGTNWANAFPDLQKALTYVNAGCAPINAVYVSKGSYYPVEDDAGALVSNRNTSFKMKNNLSVIGGFSVADGITSLALRNPAAYPAILSGDIQQDNIQNNNVYNVIKNYNTGLDSTAVLDGFTISGGWNNNTGTGAGINNVNASPKFLNCIIRDNFVTGTATAVGAGMHNLNASPVLRNCSFINNSAAATTAAFGAGMFTDNGSPKISRCIFTGNTLTTASNIAGGAIYSNGGGAVIDNSLFAGNTGSAISTNGSTFNIYNITITNNSGTAGRAGGLFLNGGLLYFFNSIIYGNLDGNITNNAAAATFFYTDLEGSGAPGNWNNAFGINGGNNKDVNPLFTIDYKLANCSPLLDAGDNTSTFGSFDIANNPRIANGTVDLGASERQTGACTLCPGETAYFYAGLTGSSYQWQLDSGSGYTNISNGGLYSGVTGNTLTITGAPTNMRGTKFRCLVNGNTPGPEQVLKFSVRWNGSANTLWSNPANWDCGVLPDAYTDVIVPLVINSPLVNSNAACYSISLQAGSSCTVATGSNLTITGK